MYLGELINRVASTKQDLDFFKEVLLKSDLSVEGANDLLNTLYIKIDRYNGYNNKLNVYLHEFTIVINESEVPLGEALGLKGTLTSKLEAIDYVIKRNSYEADIKVILDKREDLVRALFHLNVIIDTFIWSTEIEL